MQNYLFFLFQHTVNNLYTDSSIILFSTLLTLLYLISVQMLYHINAADFSDLLPCLLFIQNICKEIKFQHMLLMSLNTRINYIFRNERDSRENENAYTNSDISKLLPTNYKALLHSPKINFNLNKCVEDNLFHEKLCSSLREKGLFVRILFFLRIKHPHLSQIINNSQANIRSYLKDTNHHLACYLQHYQTLAVLGII